MAQTTSPLSRGELVLAELKLLASISAAPYASLPNVRAAQTVHKVHPFSSNLDSKTDPLDRLESSAPSDPVAVKFPRSRRTSSTTKGRSNGSNAKSQPRSPGSPGSGSQSGSGSEGNDENLHPTSPNGPKTPLAIARTVRRTISGGLSNILRPFQPNVTKEDLGPEAEPSGFRKIRRTVSNNILRAVKAEEHSRRPSLKKTSEGHRKSHSTTNSAKSANSNKRSTTITTATKSAPTKRARPSRVRESVCSRNSTISIMEYLAERRRLEETQGPEPIQLCPLDEYGRNCHLFGCDSLHMWNPDQNSSCAVIHCDCDEGERSPDHVHIDEAPPVMPFFYKPGNSASTCMISERGHESSVVESQSMISIESFASTEKQQYHQPPQAFDFPQPPEPRYPQSLPLRQQPQSQHQQETQHDYI